MQTKCKKKDPFSQNHGITSKIESATNLIKERKENHFTLVESNSINNEIISSRNILDNAIQIQYFSCPGKKENEGKNNTFSRFLKPKIAKTHLNKISLRTAIINGINQAKEYIGKDRTLSFSCINSGSFFINKNPNPLKIIENTIELSTSNKKNKN